MYGIDLLMKEHLNIIAFTEYMKNCCCAILEGADVDVVQFTELLTLHALTQISIITERKKKFYFAICSKIPVPPPKNW